MNCTETAENEHTAAILATYIATIPTNTATNVRHYGTTNVLIIEIMKFCCHYHFIWFMIIIFNLI